MSAALLKKMRDMGLTMDQAVELMEAWEAGVAAPEPTLSKGALRTRKWRANQEAASRSDVTETHHGDVSHVGERPQVVTPSLPSLRSEELSDDDVDSASAHSSSDDWPKLTSRQTWASILADTVASPWLDPTKSPGLIETAGRVVAWKRDGASWERDVVPVVTALCVKSGKRVGTWKYFDGSIGQAIADNRAALAIPEARVVPLRPGGESFADRNAADIAEARRRLLEG